MQKRLVCIILTLLLVFGNNVSSVFSLTEAPTNLEKAPASFPTINMENSRDSEPIAITEEGVDKAPYDRSIRYAEHHESMIELSEVNPINVTKQQRYILDAKRQEFIKAVDNRREAKAPAPQVIKMPFGDSKTVVSTAKGVIKPESSLLIPNNTQSLTGDETISGTVSLPSGMQAPVGGLEVAVNAYGYDEYNERLVFVSSTSIIIPEGSSAKDYSISIPSDCTMEFFQISYYIEDAKGLRVYQEGYYNGYKTEYLWWRYGYADTRNGSVDGIDISLIKLNEISGTLSLPQGMTAPVGGLEVGVEGYVSDIEGHYYYSFGENKVIMTEGNSTVDYSILVPQNEPEDGYVIFYSVTDIRDLELGYSGCYNATGTKIIPEEGTPIDASTGDIQNINIEMLRARSISGTISLPEGMVAPTGGVEVGITILDGDDNYYCDTITYIAEGKSNATYKVLVSYTNSASQYKVTYDLWDKNGLNVASSGYYSETGTKFFRDQATFIDVSTGNISNINMELLKLNIISGTVSLPSGMVAPAGGLEVTIAAGIPMTQSYLRSVEWADVTIPEGSSSVEYSMGVPINEVGNAYKLEYWIFNTKGQAIINDGYYSTSGTKLKLSDGSFVDVTAGNMDDINIEIIKGNFISGIVSLPSGIVAPTGGLEVFIETDYPNGGYVTYTDIVIPAGSSSMNYTLVSPPGVYKIMYTVWDTEGLDIAESGFYSSAGTKAAVEDASLVDISNGNAEGINIELLETNSISGTISLPSGIVAPAGGLEVYVYGSILVNNDYWQDKGGISIIIPQGSSSADYDFGVPPNKPGAGYKVSYWIDDNKGLGIFNNGCYNSLGTRINLEEGTLVDASSGSIEDIDIAIIKGNNISGIISLPEGMTAPEGGIAVWIDAYDENYDYIKSEHISIPQGSSSTVYQISVPAVLGVNYKLSYWLEDSKGLNIVTSGFYSTSGTKLNFDEGSVIDVSSGNADNININIITGNTISGTVLLPLNMLAPAGGLRLVIESTDIDHNNGSSISITIPGGSNSTSYRLTSPSNIYKLSYYIWDTMGLSIAKSGFYGISGTKISFEEASSIDIRSNDAEGINIAIFNANMISGTVSLPDNMIAPMGGLRVQISAEAQIDQDSWSNLGGINVTIPEGSNSVEYSYGVPVTQSGKGYKMRYRVIDSKGLSIAERGYYGDTGTKATLDEGTVIDASTGNVNGINMTILKGYRLSGTIALPVGLVAPFGGLRIWVEAFNENYRYISGTYLYMQQGASALPYQITMPIGAGGSGYKIRYWIDDTKGLNVGRIGFYAASGAKSTFEEGTILNESDSDIDGVNIQIINGSIISGSISLMPGMTAPEDGLYFYVIADIQINQNLWNQIDAAAVFMPAGSNSVEYSYRVPQNEAGKGYKISYWLYDSKNLNPRIAMRGYYSQNGTKATLGQGTLVDVSSGNASNINLQVIRGNKVSGTLSLPQGMIVPEGGIRLWVEAVDENNLFLSYAYYYLSQGSTAQAYSIVLPLEKVGQGYKLRYWINDSKGLNIKELGYYSTAGTKESFDQGSFLNVSSGDITGINIPLIVMTVKQGDCNSDGIVDIDDIVILSMSYGSKQGELRFDARADVDKNGEVNLLDLAILASNYNR